MDQLRKIAKETVREIDDIFDRKKAEQEIYSTLMDAYDEELLIHGNSKKALEIVIENFGSDDSIKSELKEAHIRKLGLKQIMILILLSITFLVVLYIFLMWLLGEL